MHIANFTIAHGPNVLMENCMLRLVKGHRYGLIGRNGAGMLLLLWLFTCLCACTIAPLRALACAGKTTLLRHIAHADIEGFPSDIRIMHVEQEVFVLNIVCALVASHNAARCTGVRL